MDANEKNAARSRWKHSQQHKRHGANKAAGRGSQKSTSASKARRVTAELESNAYRYDSEDGGQEETSEAGADLAKLLEQAAMEQLSVAHHQRNFQSLLEEMAPPRMPQEKSEMLALDVQSLRESLAAVPLHLLLGVRPELVAGLDDAAAASNGTDCHDGFQDRQPCAAEAGAERCEGVEDELADPGLKQVPPALPPAVLQLEPPSLPSSSDNPTLPHAAAAAANTGGSLPQEQMPDPVPSSSQRVGQAVGSDDFLDQLLGSPAAAPQRQQSEPHQRPAPQNETRPGPQPGRGSHSSTATVAVQKRLLGAETSDDFLDDLLG